MARQEREGNENEVFSNAKKREFPKSQHGSFR